MSRMIDALTVCGELIVTEQAPVPLQAPLQAASRDPVAGVAVNATMVPEEKLAVHDAPMPHEMPPGLLVTVPAPVPPVFTVKSCVDAPEVVKLCVALLNVPLAVTNRARQ
jgi:hypothetical protein